MEILEDAKVVTADGKNVGNVDRVVLDPQSREVMGIVVRSGFLLPEDKVIPIDAVDLSGGKQLRLKPGTGNLDDFPPFQETEYVPLDENERSRSAYSSQAVPPLFWYPPYGVAPVWGGAGFFGPHTPGVPEGYVPVVEENIPEGTVALTEGAAILSAEGKTVGELVKVGVDPGSGRATHMIISRGILFQAEKVIPINWIDHVDDDGVRLIVGSEFIQRLPDREDT